MLPGLIWYLVFRYFPMLGIVIAFEDYKPFWGIEGILYFKLGRIQTFH